MRIPSYFGYVRISWSSNVENMHPPSEVNLDFSSTAGELEGTLFMSLKLLVVILFERGLGVLSSNAFLTFSEPIFSAEKSSSIIRS